MNKNKYVAVIVFAIIGIITLVYVYNAIFGSKGILQMLINKKNGLEFEKSVLYDNIPTTYVLMMTIPVSVILSAAQADNENMYSVNLYIFLAGFIGSILCILLRFRIMYARRKTAERAKRRKVICYILFSFGIFAIAMVKLMIDTDLSLDCEIYRFYNDFQYFMSAIALSQIIVSYGI